MPDAERLTITLTPDLTQYVRAKVEAGEYLSSSDLIQEVLHSWQDQERLWEERMQRIRARGSPKPTPTQILH